MFTKLASAEVRAVGGVTDGPLEEGQFAAIVSVFNVVDSYGDVVMPGAFAESLAEWDAKGLPLPVIWSHQWTDIWSHIGQAVKAYETDAGLKIIGQLDLENPTAAQAYKLMKQRRINQFSFGFEVKDAAWGTRKAKDGSEQDVYELRKLSLYEVGPCLVGVNQQTELLAVKGQPPKSSSQGKTPAPSTVGSVITWATIKEIQG